MKPIRRLLAVLAALLLLTPQAMAQDLTAQEVLDRVTETAEATRDAAFLLTGRLIDPDGTVIALEVEVEVIPEESVARASFYQPDALADNVIVLDGDVVYNYIFLTNQATLFDANDPDALGGLLGAPSADAETSFTLDLDALFSGWEPSLEGYEGGAYRLRLDNKEEGAAIGHAFATVEEGTWLVTEITLVGPDDNVLAELFVEDFRQDTGLSVEDVTYIPEDAEIIDERN